MKALQAKTKKAKAAPVAAPFNVTLPSHPAPAPEPEIPSPNAFLGEARMEPKRQLIADHIETINVLRNEKRFTFRAIAEWLTARGIETDHSAVYRAYLAAIPEENRNPDDDWSDVDMPE